MEARLQRNARDREESRHGEPARVPGLRPSEVLRPAGRRLARLRLRAGTRAGRPPGRRRGIEATGDAGFGHGRGGRRAMAGGTRGAERGRMGTRRVREARTVAAGVRADVADAARAWLARTVATARNDKGRRLAATRVRRYLLPHLGRRPLRALSGDDVRGYRLALESYGLAPQTVAHVLADLRALLLWAVAEGRIERTPFPRRVLPRVPERPPHGLDDDAVRALVALPDPWGFVVRLLVGTGLRWSEACRARRADLHGGWLEVPRSKSGRVRRIPLARSLRDEILGRTDPLVPFAAGSPGSFTRVVRRRSRVADFHPHRLRHTFAMRWLSAGGSLPVLQELLGHRELATTMRYARVSDELVRREASRVARRQRRR